MAKGVKIRASGSDHLVSHIFSIVRTAVDLKHFDSQVREKAREILRLLEVNPQSVKNICIAEVLEVAESVILYLTEQAPAHKVLLQKEEKRRERKSISDARKKEEGREKVRLALLKLKHDGRPPTVLNLRWEVNQLYGDYAQRSVGNLMLAQPDYFMSEATIRRRLREMPRIIEEIFGISE